MTSFTTAEEGPGPEAGGGGSTEDHSPTPRKLSGRILSCKNCQRRKIRCNKVVPCANCVKVHDERVGRFVDAHIWVALNEEIQNMKDIIEHDEPDGVFPQEEQPSNSASISGVPSPTPSERPELDPVQTFKLWQIFLERVNPLIKIIHAPTVQPIIVAASADITSVSLDQQALLYSMFALAVMSLKKDEMVGILGDDQTKEQVLQGFLRGVSMTLVKFDFLRRYNMVVLQALVHTLIILMGQCNKHGSWVLCGSLIRIAVSMGYHRDGTQLGLAPFETEMRRRIWWQILTYDTKLSLDCGFKHNCLPTDFDTKQPLNLNDADLFTEATRDLVHREGPTEMAFVLVMHRVAAYLLDEEARQVVEASTLGHGGPDGPEINAASMERNRVLVRGLEMDLIDIERRFLNPVVSNAHAAALGIRPHLIARLYDMMRPMQESTDWGIDIFSPRDNLFKLVLTLCENANDAFDPMDRWAFAWFARLHFNFEHLTSLSTFLYQRPTDSMADRGWAVLESMYARHSLLYNLKLKAPATQAQFALKAYAQRERALGRTGQIVETPEFIMRLRNMIGGHILTC
ncbi:fungal-specific transcription factor domain-containing protein [Emericellopsis atlantica]|uniref:Fungal-specific transcription factor domain-containing protein n=1 Tax=Emericellopsis atlantica TaxID=2614577 RepID=A0A9P7ZGN5_9HYPO|nr:fungal-specific transcription factor domain-containing protein [Emericellopsis atlantica]KAG9251452.1 fungal-specific transcription factor domain-containing protein [Emericellopsis atlantica]